MLRPALQGAAQPVPAGRAPPHRAASATSAYHVPCARASTPGLAPHSIQRERSARRRLGSAPVLQRQQARRVVAVQGAQCHPLPGVQLAEHTLRAACVHTHACICMHMCAVHPCAHAYAGPRGHSGGAGSAVSHTRRGTHRALSISHADSQSYDMHKAGGRRAEQPEHPSTGCEGVVRVIGEQRLLHLQPPAPLSERPSHRGEAPSRADATHARPPGGGGGQPTPSTNKHARLPRT
jgi:hypothetical protein